MPLTSLDVQNAISDIATTSGNVKVQRYRSLQEAIFSSSAADCLLENIMLYAEAILGGAINILQARPLLISLVAAFRRCPDNEAKAEGALHVIAFIAPRIASFEEQDLALKVIVAEAFEEVHNFNSTAKALETINTDSPHHPYPADDKASLWVKIMRCYLEEGRPDKCVQYINRIKGVLPYVTSPDTKLQFCFAHARVLDSQRSFLEASTRYYDASIDTTLHETDQWRALSKAIICAILAPAGPQRAVALARLYKDERARQADEYGIMENTFFNRLLSPEETRDFEQTLDDHQRETTADGCTVLEQAILEHNVLATSMLYRNIYTRQLAALLGTDQPRAEIYAGRMIEEGRLSGYIDQIEGLIVFLGDGSGEIDYRDAIVGREQTKRDASARRLLESVESVVAMIQEHQPVRFLRNAYMI
jgi:COP9 signalosome complex subunit 4